MLVSLIATDRNEVKADANVLRDQSWISIQLARRSGDFANVMLSISVDVARELVAQLPRVIEDAERLAKQTEVSSNA